MKQVLLYVPAVLLLAFVAARAQGTVEVRDDVVFSTNDVTEKQQKLSFGFGTDYTDTTDFNKGEMILPPFFPPDGFFVYFGVKDKFGSEDFATIDIRGVPDSVKAGRQFFSQNYLLRIQRHRGQDVSITFPFPMRRGVDSVVFESTQPGANFRGVFTDRGTIKIPNSLITTLKMTAFYNYDRAAAVPLAHAAGTSGMRLVPNPARIGMMVTAGEGIPANAHLMVTDVRGQIVRDEVARHVGAGVAVDLRGFAPGLYFVRVLGNDGAVLATDRLLVTD